jgi:hypothetical protein
MGRSSYDNSAILLLAAWHGLGVCCASRFKSKKIADQAIFYPANCQRSPFIEGFSTGTRRV